MKKEIKTEITIKSAPEKIWDILTDFDNYSNWNPFIKLVTGKVAVGNQIEIKLKQSENKTMIFKPRVLILKENEELRWLGHLFIKGLFDGEHKFELVKKNDKETIFKQSEKFSGILLPLFKKQLENNTKMYFEDMNKELKKLVEDKAIKNEKNNIC